MDAIAAVAQFKKESPIAAEVAGLGVANPPTDHENFDYWNRVSRCVYLNRCTDKYVWNSHGDARHYIRESNDYVLEKEADFELLPNDATKPFMIEIGKITTGAGTTDVDASVESQLEELGYL